MSAGPSSLAPTSLDDRTPSGGATHTISQEGTSFPPILPEEKYDPRKATGCVGLYNQGATCYMNTVLQLFFHIPYFREAVYMMATEADHISEIPKALQNLFFQLQERKYALSTKCLTDAFGWDDREVFVQHDIQELAAKLRDTLEGKMKGTPAEGAINRMFVGIGENVVETLDGLYKTSRREIFYDIHLPVVGYKNIMASLKSLVAKDKLVGDNKYKVEEEGKPPVYKDAETGYRFLKFPPIVLFHLKRFEMDMLSPTLEMKKINTELEFTTTIDVSELEHRELLTPADIQGGELKRLHHEENADSELPKTPTVSEVITGAEQGEATYDLFSVIVHRGGVRSGHYYSYIRDYDPATKTWSRWNQFDDDDVRPVSEQTVVEKNFGGYVYSFIGGRETAIPATHSAYILAYMRRVDLPRLVYPIQTDVIPRYVKDEFERVLREEERIQREEEEKARCVTFNFFNDDDIRRHVSREVFELIPARNGQSLQLTMSKKDRLVSLYEILRKERGYDIIDIRLWKWRFMLPNQLAGFRPDEPLPLAIAAGSMTIEESLKKFHPNDEHKAWTETLYIEKRREFVPPLITNVILSDLQSATMSTCSQLVDENFDPRIALKKGSNMKFDSSDFEPMLTITFSRPYTVQYLIFRCLHSKNIAPCDITYRFMFYQTPSDEEPFFACNEVRSCTLQAPSSLVVVHLQPSDPKVQMVKISRVGMQYRMAASLTISRVAVHVPPSELSMYQSPTSKAPVLPPYDDRHVLLMVKAFSHKAGAITYVGPLIVNKNDPLTNCFPSLRHMLHLAEETPLLLFDETKPYPICSLPEWQSAHPQECNLLNGNVITVQQHPKTISLLYRFVRADHVYNFFDNQRVITVRNYTNSADPGLQLPMQLTWKFDRVVEVIGEHVGIDPEFIRIYGSTSFSHPAPKAEAERSDMNSTLESMLRIRHYLTSDLFYEKLPVKLSVVESQLQLKVTVCDRIGKAIGAEQQFLLPAGSSVSQIVTRTLELSNLLHLIDQFSGRFVFMEIGDHLIQHFYETDLLNETLAPESIHRLTQTGRTFEVRPYTPPKTGETMYCVCHADNTCGQVFGVPFLMNIPDSYVIDDVLQVLLDATQVPFDEVIDPYRYGCMMQTLHILNFPEWKTTQLYKYFLHTPNPATHPRHLVLNHKMPREKPGSRYVALNEPQLVLEKKKKPQEAAPVSCSARPSG